MMRAPQTRMTVVQLRKHVDGRFSRLNRKMSTRFKEVDARIRSLESTMEHRFEVLMREMNRGFESLGAKIDSLQRSTDHRLKPLEKVVDVHENRFKDMDRAARG
jgi:hypothetical protein